MVTSHKMNENEMGYRGSKSVSQLGEAVKEQRVDGSYCISPAANTMQLRYTLMGFERNYQIKIPTKQLINRTISTSSTQINVNPWFITGFSYAESTFVVSIYRDGKLK